MIPEQLPPLVEPYLSAQATASLLGQNVTDPLYTADQMHAYATAATAALRAELAKIRTVMIAAAEEISEHWDAHCDAEGYGPANLMHRLEHGIPSEYGYTAGAFAKLRAELDALRRDAERYRWLRDKGSATWVPFQGQWKMNTSRCDAAIDAAMKETP